MLEDKDIEKLKEELATKEDLENSTTKILSLVATKEELAELKQEASDLKEVIQSLTISVDKLAKAVDNLRTEYAALTLKIDRHEKWIRKLAEKLGVKLEY